MAAAASPISMAATGLSAFSSISAGDTAAQNAQLQSQQAMGQAQNALDQASQTRAYDKYQAKTLSNSAEYGRISAAQTDADLRMALSDKLANIAAVRGAANVDPSSPTGAAILARTSEVADIDRGQRVGNIAAQTAQDQLASSYYQSAGRDAIRIGQMQAQQYETAAQMYQDNASTDEMGGFLGAFGAGLKGLAGLKFS